MKREMKITLYRWSWSTEGFRDDHAHSEFIFWLLRVASHPHIT